MLQAKLFERAEQITARRLGRDTSSWQPEDMSLLTAIMGITKEVS
jgi:non-canonical poly(A) RNA polymerase PAPD5/7